MPEGNAANHITSNPETGLRSIKKPSPLLAPLSRSDRAAMYVRSALERFLNQLDSVQDILDVHRDNQDKPRPESSELLKSVGKPLQAKERKAVEQAVDAFYDAVHIARQDVQVQLNEELAAANIPHVDASKTYPLSPEESSALNSWVSSRAAPMREQYDKYLAPFDNPLQVHYADAYIEWRGRESSDQMLGAAMLPRLVSSFEQFLGSLLRTGLNLYPDALGPYGDVPYELTSRFQDLKDIQRYMVDHKIQQLLKDRPEDWAKRAQKWPGVDFTASTANWNRICEIIQRRHVLIHHDGIADDEYVGRLRNRIPDLSVGTRLVCDNNYMTEALITLRYFALSVASQWAWKLGKVSPLTTHPLYVRELVQYFEKKNRNCSVPVPV